MQRNISRAVWIAVGVIVMLVGGGVLYLVWSGTPPGQVAELATEGGDKLLRDPMRPARGTTRVLVFALDGVGDEEFRRAVAAGVTPHISALLGDEAGEPGLYRNAFAVPEVLSVLPSTTLAAWSALFTGEPAARTGVPGNEWFTRDEMRFYAPAPVSVAERAHSLEVYTDGLMGRVLQVPTVYEKVDVRSHVSLSHLYRGADLLTTPDPTVLGDLAVATAEGLAGEDKVSQEAYAELDRSSIDNLVASLREHGIPDLQVVYFPGVDLYTHVAERPIHDQQRYLREVIDPSVARVLEEYRARGAMGSTYVLFVADHGHTPVLSDDRHALGTTGEDEPPAVLEAVGFRVRPFVLEPGEDEQDYQAVVAYQGAIAYVYLADRSTCPEPGTRCDWTRPPRLEEDVLPVATAFWEASETGARVPALKGTLDLVFSREPRAPGEDALPFQVWDGDRLVPIGAYLQENPRPELLELERRMKGLAAGPFGHRAGDVLLLARSGPERPIEERFYFSAPYASWHGSASAQDGHIPLVVARSGSTGAELRDRVRAAVGERPSQLDVTALIERLLTTDR